MKVEKWERSYQISSAEIRRISRYTGLNFNEVEELPLKKYFQYNRDSWIESWNMSEDGREFLKTLWRLQQTEADEDAIEEFKGMR